MPDALEIARPEPITPMRLLEMAMSQGAELDKMQQLMDLQERWQANMARQSYLQAMSDFKKEPIVVTKDKTNKQYESKYTSIGNLVNTVTPFLSKHGLSAEWELDQSDGIRVGCRITHSMGHSGETKWMKVPLDTSGAKNPLQQVKSSVTYAKIATFEMATGLASADGNLDDDGNASGNSKLDDQLLVAALDNIDNCRDLVELQRVFIAAVKGAKAAKDKDAEVQMTRAKDARKRELQEGL